MGVSGRIVVSETYCKGCALCRAACPPGVLDLDPTRLTARGYHPAVLTGPGCTGCGICALVCPEAALTVYRTRLLKQEAADA